MEKVNTNCQCPNAKCPNQGVCANCVKYHHKGLHTYCRAGKMERALRQIHARVTGNTKNEPR